MKINSEWFIVRSTIVYHIGGMFNEIYDDDDDDERILIVTRLSERLIYLVDGSSLRVLFIRYTLNYGRVIKVAMFARRSK